MGGGKQLSMNKEKNIWHDQQNDLESLALEISEIKNILRELSQQILRIDRRVRVVLPSPEKFVDKKSARPRLEAKSACAIVSRLTKHARDGEQIEDELRRMNVKDELSILARELGMTNTKLPPKHDLVRRIATRIRQRASVEIGICRAAEPNSGITD